MYTHTYVMHVCGRSFGFLKNSITLCKYVFVITPSVGYGDTLSLSTADDRLMQRGVVYAS